MVLALSPESTLYPTTTDSAYVMLREGRYHHGEQGYFLPPMVACWLLARKMEFSRPCC
jgi:hypothetical protein